MKILFIHNFHRSDSSSGDDVVVNNELNLLRTYGNIASVFSENNSDFETSDLLSKLTYAIQIPWSFRNYDRIQKTIRAEDPDIVHIHTFFPFITPSVYSAIDQMNIPIVQTLHDFRFFCANAFLYREGETCEDCIKHGKYLSMVHRCFNDSMPGSILTMSAQYFAKWVHIFDKITAFITFTNFGKSKFSSFGVPQEKIFIKPHFMYLNGDVKSTSNSKKYYLFLGRIGHEKGIEFLVNTWRLLDNIPLKIAGSGPLAEKVNRSVQHFKNVEYLGFVPHDRISEVLNDAYAVIVPSIWYETFGMVIMEAYAHGIPVIATNLGAMADLVLDRKSGLLFERKNEKNLTEMVKWLWDHPEECKRMGENARREYEEKYTPEKNYIMLMDIYEKTIEMHKRRK